MRRAAAFILLCLASASARAQEPGTFVGALEERSPLTTPAELERRLGKDAVPPYEVTETRFLVHVPDGPPPGRGHGIVVFMNYRDGADVPPTWPPLLKDRGLIFAMNTHPPKSGGAAAATAVDAVHNIAKTYEIDRDRVYVLGIGGVIHSALAYPDVFTGALAWSRVEYVRPIDDPMTGGTFPAALERVGQTTLQQAKSRPILIATRPDLDEATARYHALLVEAMRADGFARVTPLSIRPEDFNYPNLSPAWLATAVDFFENPQQPAASATAAAPPPPDRNTRPIPPIKRPTTLSEPRRLLTLAHYFLKNKAYPSARERLEEIIQTYPQDPAAQEARTLLDSINRIAPPTLEWKNETRGKRR